MLIAIGMTFVIISGGIDLSVGSLFALAGVLTAYGAQWGIARRGRAAAAWCAALIGLVNGLLIGRARIAPFIVTLAALLFARGLAFAASQEGNKVYLIPADLALTRIGQATVARRRARRCWSRWRRSPSGWSCSTGPGSARRCSPSAAARRRRADGAAGGPGQGAGLRAQRRCWPALAGILVAAQTSSGLPTIGEGRELEAIAAVVIGGTLLTGGAGSLSGTLAGVLLLKVIQNLINQVGTLSAYYQQVVSGVFLLRRGPDPVPARPAPAGDTAQRDSHMSRLTP